jgi:hypothetical protein
MEPMPRPAPAAPAAPAPPRPTVRYPLIIKPVAGAFIAPAMTALLGLLMAFQAVAAAPAGAALALSTLVLAAGALWLWSTKVRRIVISDQGVERRSLWGSQALARDQIGSCRPGGLPIGSLGCWVLTPKAGGRGIRIPLIELDGLWLETLVAGAGLTGRRGRSAA